MPIPQKTKSSPEHNVKQRKSPAEKPLRDGWLLIGQLKLPIDSMSGKSIEDWLIGTLEPFRLSPDIFGRLKVSIEEAISQLAVTPDYDYAPSISIYMSDDVRVAHLPKNWGFFKIEKVDMPSNEEALGEYIIEYYLYSER
ncbi:MAG: hypothetical protein AB8I58_10880 [Anaerolineales bacterium]